MHIADGGTVRYADWAAVAAADGVGVCECGV